MLFFFLPPDDDDDEEEEDNEEDTFFPLLVPPPLLLAASVPVIEEDDANAMPGSALLRLCITHSARAGPHAACNASQNCSHEILELCSSARRLCNSQLSCIMLLAHWASAGENPLPIIIAVADESSDGCDSGCGCCSSAGDGGDIDAPLAGEDEERAAATAAAAALPVAHAEDSMALTS